MQIPRLFMLCRQRENFRFQIGVHVVNLHQFMVARSKPSRGVVRYRAREAVRQLALKLVYSWTKAGIPIQQQRRMIREFRRAIREFHNGKP
jgi:hypothetical protein